MIKLLVKIAEKYAKSENLSCPLLGILHQPQRPDCLIKKD